MAKKKKILAKKNTNGGGDVKPPEAKNTYSIKKTSGKLECFQLRYFGT